MFVYMCVYIYLNSAKHLWEDIKETGPVACVGI